MYSHEFAGSFAYHFQAWQDLGKGTYQRVPWRDVDVCGRDVYHALSALAMSFGMCSCADPLELSVHADGLMYLIPAWPGPTRLGVSLN